MSAGKLYKWVGNAKPNFSYNTSARVSRYINLLAIALGAGRKPGMQRDPNTHVPASNYGWFLSRRGLLRRAGWAAAAAGFSRVPALAEVSISPTMARLSSYMSEARNLVL